MASKKKGTMYILIIILTPIILFFTLTRDFIVRGEFEITIGSFMVFAITLFSGFALAYLIYRIEEKFFSKNIKFEDIQQKKSKERYRVEKSPKKRSKFGGFFSSKDECDTCGTKMKYKEGMDSYYCPECHEYK